MVVVKTNDGEKVENLVALRISSKNGSEIKEEEILLDGVSDEELYRRREEEIKNFKNCIDRLVNLKIDIKKQSVVGNVNFNQKQLNKMICLLSHDSSHTNPKYSYSSMKIYLEKLKKKVNSNSLTFKDAIKVINVFEKYENENVNSLNPSVNKIVISIKALKEIVILKLYKLVINKALDFKNQMDQFISLYENKMLLDDDSLNAALEQMEEELLLIKCVYNKYFISDSKLGPLYRELLARKERIIIVTSNENKKGM